MIDRRMQCPCINSLLHSISSHVAISYWTMSFKLLATATVSSNAVFLGRNASHASIKEFKYRSLTIKDNSCSYYQATECIH